MAPIIEETAREVVEKDYLGPDDTVDVSQPLSIGDDAKAWSTQESISDGHLHNFIWERSANYLWRTITLDAPQTVTVSVGCTDAFKLWVNGELLVDQRAPRPLPSRQYEFEVELRSGENRLLAKVVNISWDCNFYFALRNFRGRIPAAIEQILGQASDQRSPADVEKLSDYYLENVLAADEYHALRSELLARQRQLEELNSRITTTMVMREMKEPRTTFRLDRGQYDSPKEEIAAATPAVLPPLPDNGDRNRLALAKWLMAPSHPLTARVTVNRLWQLLFGQGIVSTAGDFGTQGDWPSHQELLDWLAVEFVESGWDVKHMLRMMVMSSTYQQSSVATPEKLERDPANRLLSRGPRFRLQAELIRDLAMQISGLMNSSIGGPSAKTYQPPGLWLELAHQKDNSKFTAQKFEQATGAALYRRGLYTFWKRSVPPPNLVTFDAPNRETCVVQRETTNTPLQALVLLNDPTFVEASRQLAERIIKEADAPEARVRWGFMLATSRHPTARELEILLDKYRWHLEEFQTDVDAAEKLLEVGDSARDDSIDVAEHAAWTCVASMILNLDETITKE